MTTQAVPTFKPRFDYARIMGDVYLANGDWVEIPLDRLTGATLNQKQAALTHAASARKMKIQTASDGGRIYARLRVFTTK